MRNTLGISLAAVAVVLIAAVTGAKTVRPGWPKTPTLPPRKTMMAVKTTKAPVIDGKLDDEAWKTAPKFTFGFTIGTPASPRQATVGQVIYDAQYLYVAYDCSETEMELLLAGRTERDSDTWADDCIELFLDTNRDEKTYCQFVINPRGTVFDQKDGKTEINMGIEVAAGRTDHGWTVEAAIKLADLGLKPGVQDWGFNMNRVRPAKPGGGYQDTCWSPLGRWKSASPDRFGLLMGIEIKPSSARE